MPDRTDLDRAVDHILDVVVEERGYDFRDYQKAFVTRRLRRVSERHVMQGGVMELAVRVGEHPELIGEIIESLSLGVTELFRDPEFWAVLRNSVMPELAAKDFVRAWVAGCATGEEAFSLAILMQECGLEGRFRIYATDINESALGRARKGRIRWDALPEARRAYARSGGTGELDRFLDDEHCVVGAAGDAMVFARHNLVSDRTFNSFHLVLCRNVLIYFNAELHRQVHDTLFDSLMPGAVLGLGAKESLRISRHARQFETIDAASRLYRRRL